MHKTTQFLPNGEYNRYYSLLPPAMNNTGASLVIIVQSIKLKGADGEVFGIKEDRVLLMGNAQAIVGEQCTIDEFLTEFPQLKDEERELIRDLLNKQLAMLESQANQE